MQQISKEVATYIRRNHPTVNIYKTVRKYYVEEIKSVENIISKYERGQLKMKRGV
ncbi:MAG: hypothetical protein PHV07_01635 [Oscillospiraceae bacterium]|nr:hypothetical protein [Oscillospiraceae bacterium]